ncbi:lysine-specific demethylase 4D-like [Thrips palmi]|uniref:Lysine-specific demethylase 4D-like n=1 Tax=Thrips palmi TaxID=161013 RepID=A0A6P8ZUV2_THRPL|nr:lysine-specific demethylase 4D-like [Thrips palmi]
MEPICPTWEDFQSFNGFVKHTPKILLSFFFVNPPQEWKKLMTNSSEALQRFTFTPRTVTLQPNREHSGFQVMTARHLSHETVSEFRERCAKQYDTPIFKTCQEFLENSPCKAEMGVDLRFKLYPPSLKVWNLECLGDPMSNAQKQERNIPGVTSPFLTIASSGAPFALRTEKHNLGSIYYLHEGEPREW